MLISVSDKGKPRVKHSHSTKQQMHTDIMHTRSFQMRQYSGVTFFVLWHTGALPPPQDTHRNKATIRKSDIK